MRHQLGVLNINDVLNGVADFLAETARQHLLKFSPSNGPRLDLCVTQKLKRVLLPMANVNDDEWILKLRIWLESLQDLDCNYWTPDRPSSMLGQEWLGFSFTRLSPFSRFGISVLPYSDSLSMTLRGCPWIRGTARAGAWTPTDTVRCSCTWARDKIFKHKCMLYVMLQVSQT